MKTDLQYLAYKDIPEILNIMFWENKERFLLEFVTLMLLSIKFMQQTFAHTVYCNEHCILKPNVINNFP